MVTEELINYRKKEAKRLQNLIIKKLQKVLRLVAIRIREGKKVYLGMCSFSQGAKLHYVGDLEVGHEFERIRLEHWDFMSFEFDNCI